MLASIKKIGKMGLENIIQGHGDIILRGEIDAAVRENVNYLNNIKKAVKAGGKRKNVDEYLEEIAIEDCGKSRVYLGWAGRDPAPAQPAGTAPPNARRISTRCCRCKTGLQHLSFK
ncbi:MAG: hypothetical protein IPJ47_17395 [Anaerolineales bacterium]|nr:hypothetical protein [Anaerolineales bacterium]